MSGVSERTLNWLFSVLGNEYHDPRRTYSDIADLLSRQTGAFKLRTQVYTYENGTFALLVNIYGTLSLTIRDQPHRVPLSIWIPHRYPREAPIVYVIPEQGAVIEPGNHVSGEGRLYHPYLAQWSEYWDRSSLTDLVEIARGVFSKESPLRISQYQSIQTSTGSTQQPPPPIPPPSAPDERQRGQRTPHTPSLYPGAKTGPPPPPKTSNNVNGTFNEIPAEASGNGPPPLPPLPPEMRSANHQMYGTDRPYAEHQLNSALSQQSRSGRDAGQMPPNAVQHRFQEHQPHPQHTGQGIRNAAGVMTSDVGSASRLSSRQMSPNSIPPQALSPNITNNQGQAQQHNYGFNNPQPHLQFSHAQPYSGPVSGTLSQSSSRQVAVDLLSSPLDVTLPSQNPSSQASIPLPPVPPNPQKDALLTALSQSLHQQLTMTLSSNASAAASLQAQNYSLQVAMSRLQSELRSIEALEKELDSNERILRDTMHEADRVMADATTRRRPEVDEVLVAPTVVGNQLYRDAAEVQALVDVRAVLGRGLDNGTIGAHEWSRLVRNLAREEFSKRALVRKIGRGMRLDETNRGQNYAGNPSGGFQQHGNTVEENFYASHGG